MEINDDKIVSVFKDFKTSFYILDSKQFEINYNNLLQSFRKYYPNTYIAYSYKTNYTPKLCKLIDEMGGFAEIVSDMEGEIAYRVGVHPAHIYFNGPYKNMKFVEKLLLDGGCVNVDSLTELKQVIELSKKHKEIFNIALRLNFNIEDGVVSRFGFDVMGNDFIEAINLINKNKTLHLKGLHSHFASRNITYWPNRIKGIIEVIEKYFPNESFEFIDLGGGLFGNMKDTLKAQFDTLIPSYEDYAQSVAIEFEKYFRNKPYKPMLFIEPGSALAGDVMKFVAKVVSIKSVRGKSIATLLGSIYNINPTLNKKNPPIHVIHCGQKLNHYQNLDFGGFTCIESDYLYKNYNGDLAEEDLIVFDNVGSYSIVLKPPFILPNFPVVDLSDDKVEIIKREENFDDLFHTYKMNF
ncbi:MAG: hypothetical protein K2P14_05785 [Anaeroplasmataceae bacterium]|nr:hypothetical protein [Anaeroplasmataceae bacterium]